MNNNPYSKIGTERVLNNIKEIMNLAVMQSALVNDKTVIMSMDEAQRMLNLISDLTSRIYVARQDYAVLCDRVGTLSAHVRNLEIQLDMRKKELLK